MSKKLLIFALIIAAVVLVAAYANAKMGLGLGMGLGSGSASVGAPIPGNKYLTDGTDAYVEAGGAYYTVAD
jgi:hypothetical protein